MRQAETLETSAYSGPEGDRQINWSWDVVSSELNRADSARQWANRRQPRDLVWVVDATSWLLCSRLVTTSYKPPVFFYLFSGGECGVAT